MRCEAEMLREGKGTGACMCSTNNRKLDVVVWPARQHCQQLELQQ